MSIHRSTHPAAVTDPSSYGNETASIAHARVGSSSGVTTCNETAIPLILAENTRSSGSDTHTTACRIVEIWNAMPHYWRGPGAHVEAV